MFVISRREGGFFIARYWLFTIYFDRLEKGRINQ